MTSYERVMVTNLPRGRARQEESNIKSTDLDLVCGRNERLHINTMVLIPRKALNDDINIRDVMRCPILFVPWCRMMVSTVPMDMRL